MNDYGRRLLHRWLVQYNPLYLLSASLCLVGMFVCSRELAHTDAGVLAVAGIAEVYACVLIGGAALLMRIGQRRPAVMLAVLTAVYQCDLTLHTEACALLDTIGVVASAVWLALFVVKLRALAWAMRLRIPAGATALLVVGATGVAVFPHVLADLPARGANLLVGTWLLVLFAAGQYGGRALVVTSATPLEAWGETVLRRSVKVVWAVFALLVLLHVGFWSLHTSLQAGALWPLVLLLGTRWLSGETQVWAVTAGTVLLVGAANPTSLSAVSLLAALTLAARAWRHRESVVLTASSSASPFPYRMGDEPAGATRTWAEERHLSRAARGRLVTGSLYALHLSAWSSSYVGGTWPTHVVALDVALVIAVVLLVLVARVRIAGAPLVMGAALMALRSGLVPHPESTLGWGATAVGAGFVLLLGSLAASYWLRDVGREQGDVR